jgi:quercetin dioxygenase-like cupin family protein
MEMPMIRSRNADTVGIRVTSIEGAPCHGGELLVKPLIAGDEMTLLEIHYAPGAGAQQHVHRHESVIYVVTGKVKSRVADREYVLGPGDGCRHPRGVPHSVEAIEESLVVEVKAVALAVDEIFNR